MVLGIGICFYTIPEASGLCCALAGLRRVTPLYVECFEQLLTVC
jgi:hypothetical protein